MAPLSRKPARALRQRCGGMMGAPLPIKHRGFERVAPPTPHDMVSPPTTLSRHVGGQNGAGCINRRGASKVVVSAARQLIMAPRPGRSLGRTWGLRKLFGAVCDREMSLACTKSSASGHSPDFSEFDIQSE